jgi:hypothetical protein
VNDTTQDMLTVAIVTVDESGPGDRLNLAIRRIPRKAETSQGRGGDRRSVDLTSRGLN